MNQKNSSVKSNPKMCERIHSIQPFFRKVETVISHSSLFIFGRILFGQQFFDWSIKFEGFCIASGEESCHRYPWTISSSQHSMDRAHKFVIRDQLHP